MRIILRKIRGKITPALLGAAALAAVAGCGRGSQTVVPPQAIVRLSDQFASDFALIDQTGAARTDEEFRGRVAVVYFGFATCPDVCPLALGTLSAALNELTERERAGLAPLFITVDPERDTPDALKAYLAFDERLIGLTGSAEAAAAARAGFKVYAKRAPLPDSALGYTMDHTSLFYIVDRDGRPRLAVHDSVNAAELAAVLRQSLKGRLG